MGRLINADTIVHWQSYDDEHETFPEQTGTIADLINQMTEEGCPDAVNAVPMVHGRWIPCHPLGDDAPEGYMCSVCRVGGWEKTNFCPNCGAKLDEKDDGDD